jgi:uncharacterized protein (DUF1330 family)
MALTVADDAHGRHYRAGNRRDPARLVDLPPTTTANAEAPMKSYAIGILAQVELGPAIVAYLQRIDATLAPYGGRFLVHGATADVREGADPGAVIVIEFPDRTGARQWYGSAAYGEILALRTENAVSTVLLLDGVEEPHRATDVLGAPA